MILFTYLLKRYLCSFLAINSMLTLLFVCVEFFEKLLHAPQASAGTILQFLALSCIPTWFDYLPATDGQVIKPAAYPPGLITCPSVAGWQHCLYSSSCANKTNGNRLLSSESGQHACYASLHASACCS